MNLFTRMRDLMFQDATLNTIFGPTFDVNKFRVFDRQIPPSQIKNGTCAAINVVSTVFHNLHNTPMRSGLNEPRVSIYVADPRPSRADAGVQAVMTFMDRANFWKNGAFKSPRTTDMPGTNELLNQRGSFITFQTADPIPVEILDYRVKNVDTAA